MTSPAEVATIELHKIDVFLCNLRKEESGCQDQVDLEDQAEADPAGSADRPEEDREDPADLEVPRGLVGRPEDREALVDSEAPLDGDFTVRRRHLLRPGVLADPTTDTAAYRGVPSIFWGL